jgi:hypothetical protein
MKSNINYFQQKISFFMSKHFKLFKDFWSEFHQLETIFNNICHKFQNHLSIRSFIFPDETRKIINYFKNITISCEYFEIEKDIYFRIIQEKQTIYFHPIIKELGKECFSSNSSLISINILLLLHSLGERCFSGFSSLT